MCVRFRARCRGGLTKGELKRHALTSRRAFLAEAGTARIGTAYEHLATVAEQVRVLTVGAGTAFRAALVALLTGLMMCAGSLLIACTRATTRAGIHA